MANNKKTHEFQKHPISHYTLVGHLALYLAVARCFSCFTVVNKKKEKRAIKSKNDHYSTHDLSGSSRVLLANAQAAEKSVREE